MPAEELQRSINDGRPTVSVVVPIYNESPNLPAVTDRLEKVLEKFPGYEIIYVNDGSSDESR